MNRDEQIEEMARDICEWYGNNGICYQDDQPCDLKCEHWIDAQYLYEKGYRKIHDDVAIQCTCYALGCQAAEKIKAEVAREIFEEIEAYMRIDAIDERFPFMAINPDKYAILKKKYTEGEG